MKQTSSPNRAEPCARSDDALASFGIDGRQLRQRTHDDLVEDGFGTYEPTAAYVDRLAQTFRAVLAEQADLLAIPEDVDAAIDDAVHATLSDHDGNADLRTDVVRTFYRSFAGFYCAYRGRPLDEQ